MRSTFSGFYVAKGGLDAARANLNITGQNMANANVPGYTRQRVDLFSNQPSGYNNRYSNSNPSIGDGVSIGGTSQLRDPYLDVRYRTEHSKFGDTTTQASTLNDLNYIFDEIMKDGVDKQFDDFFKQLQNLSTNASDPVAEGIVKTSAEMLMKMFKTCSAQIDKVKGQQLDYFEDAITQVNELLTGISDINYKIKQSHIAGSPALELEDTRNMMIDELSGYLPIEKSTSLIDIGNGTMIEEISIELVTIDGDKFNLVDHDEARSIDIVRDDDLNIIHPVKIKLIGADGLPVGGSDRAVITLDDGLIGDHVFSGAIAGHLDMINSKGEFDVPAGSGERGIAYYENMLNELVSTFANEFNAANSTNGGPDWDKPMFEAIGGVPIIDLGVLDDTAPDGTKGPLADLVINVNPGKTAEGSANFDADGKLIGFSINLPPDATNADLQKAIQDVLTKENGVGGAIEGKLTPDQIKAVSVDGNPLNGTTFGSNLSRPKITAGNIGISEKWQNTTGSYITETKAELGNVEGTESDKGNNIQYMIKLLSKDINYAAPGSNVPLFKGTFQGMFSNISVTLGMESKDMARQNDGYAIELNAINNYRNSVSSVNIDEEGINLIQHNHALTASSRYMTTLDEAVDTIINRMGIVGR